MRHTDTIQTLRPDGKKGIVLLKHYYEQISNFILSSVYAQEQLTLHELLEKGEQKLADAIDSEITWYLLQVKLDLEARGYIKSVTPVYQKRLYLLKITRLGVKKLKSKMPDIIIEGSSS
jgi:hypothetical protein